MEFEINKTPPTQEEIDKEYKNTVFTQNLLLKRKQKNENKI